jgi:hypothetical protein
LDAVAVELDLVNPSLAAWGRIIDALAGAHDAAVQMTPPLFACISMEPASRETSANRWEGHAAA